MRTRRTLTTGMLTLLLAGTGLLIAPTASATTTTCPAGWGSSAKVSTTHRAARLLNVRAGAQPCHDRIVLDLAGPITGYDVRYVSDLRTEGEGRLVPTRGGAKLQVVVRAAGYDAAGRATYRPANAREIVPTAGYRTLRQGVWLGSFEGQSSIGLGVRARLPFTVTTMPSAGGSGTRLVIDIAHTW